jgi:Tfp pilus assembly protein PilN
VRPINLIPSEEQRRNRGVGSRSGPLPFLLVGGLALLLIGVVMLLHFSHQVSDREDEVANLQTQKEVASAQAARLAPYTAFSQLAEQRTTTIAQLADARFDWSRVIKQLATILPSDVYFTSLSGSAGGASGEDSILVPSLSIAGCASSQDGVAAFVSTLKQIDGVTRVSLEHSMVGEGSGEASGASACGSSTKTTFSILVAFDGAPPTPDGEIAEPEAEVSESESESSEGETEGSTEESSETESSEGEPASTQSASTVAGGAAG